MKTRRWNSKEPCGIWLMAVWPPPMPPPSKIHCYVFRQRHNYITIVKPGYIYNFHNFLIRSDSLASLYPFCLNFFSIISLFLQMSQIISAITKVNLSCSATSIFDNIFVMRSFVNPTMNSTFLFIFICLYFLFYSPNFY